MYFLFCLKCFNFKVNDYIVKVNMENLRNVTNSQARAILKRTNLIGTQCKFVLFCFCFCFFFFSPPRSILISRSIVIKIFKIWKILKILFQHIYIFLILPNWLNVTLIMLHNNMQFFHTSFSNFYSSRFFKFHFFSPCSNATLNTLKCIWKTKKKKFEGIETFDTSKKPNNFFSKLLDDINHKLIFRKNSLNFLCSIVSSNSAPKFSM